MELEDKVKTLEEEFQGLSKLLIKRTLCGDDVNEDLTEARQKLQKFTKSPFLSNPMAATGAKEFGGSRCCPRVDSLSKKINSWSEEDVALNSESIQGDSNDTLDQSVVRDASAELGLQAASINDQLTPFQAYNPKRLSPSLNGQQTELVSELANRVSAGLKFAGRPKYLSADNSEILGKKPVMDSTTKAEGFEAKTKARRAPDPPKPKPKPNWRKQRERDKDCKESRGASPSSHAQPIPPTPPLPIQSLLPPSGPPSKRLSPSPPPPQQEQKIPPEHDRDCKKSRQPPSSSYATPVPPAPQLRIQSLPPPSLPRKRLAPLPPPPPQEEQLSPTTPPHKQSTPSLPQAPSPSPPPPPPLPPNKTAQPRPPPQVLPQAPSPSPPSPPPLPPKTAQSKPPPQVLSNKSWLDKKDAITDTTRKGDEANLNNSNNIQEDTTDLQEKLRTLKEEFSSLPKVLIKKTLCGDDVDGDLTKARQRLQEFKQLKDPGDRLKNSMAAELVTGKLNLDMNNSPLLAGKARYSFEEQNLRGGGGANLLPRNWIPMPRDDRGNDVTVHVVRLDSSSSEYQDVEERIQETVHFYEVDIMSIERIQNPYLYQAYQLLKQKMERDNGESNERQLFHGTNPDNIKKINTQGFDRSFSGSAHGALYGSGVYFARDASYSIHYASSDGSHRYMYLARVLVGQCCQGRKSMRKPPPIHPAQPEILFDSMVDNTCDPSIFVIYYDSQSYPEYLITFY